MVAQSLSLGQWLLLGKTCVACLGACEAPVGPAMTCVPKPPSLIRSTSTCSQCDCASCPSASPPCTPFNGLGSADPNVSHLVAFSNTGADSN
jgi:hypothetical protein